MTTLGQRINIILQECSLKKTEFARSLGISANYVSLLSAGKKIVISETLAKLIENIYGYSFKWLMTGEGEKQPQDLLSKTIRRIKSMDSSQLEMVNEFLDSKDI